MAVFSEQRFNLPTHDVATSRVTAPADTTTASAIKAFGAVGGEAYRGYREGELLNNLQETGDIINTINAGDEAVRDAVKEGSIDPTTKRFQSLALATNQGKISQQRATIEAEVLLRESIAKAPGFADHFRKTARESLGFDPSSASLNTLFLSGPDLSKTQPLTQEQKDMQQAEAMFNGGAVDSPEQGFRLIQQERADELREGIQGSKIQRGQLHAGKVAVEGATRAVTKFNTVMVGAFQQIKTQGGVSDIEAFKGAIMSQADIVKSKIEQEMASSEEYAYTPQHYNEVRARIDEQRDSYLEILDNQDLTNVLAKNRDRLADLVEIAGIHLAPDLAIMKTLGEPALIAYMDLMTLSEGDPRLMKEMMAQDPRKAFVGNLVLQVRDLSGSIKAQADGSLGAMVAEGRLDRQTAQVVGVDQANAVVDGKPTAASIGNIFEGLKQTDMPRTALDMVAKTSQRSYLEMTPDERTSVVDSVRTVSRAQLSSIHQSLSQSPIGGLRLGFKGGKFVIVDSQNRPGAEIPTVGLFGTVQGPTAFASPEAEQQHLNAQLTSASGAEDALNYLNESILPIMQNPNWNREMGLASGEEFAEDLIRQVNFAQMGTEVEQGGPILDSMTPEQVGKFRTAWNSKDLQGVMEVLGNLPEAGIQPNVEGFQSGVVRRTEQAPAEAPAVFPSYQGNQVPEGLTGASALIYDFEGGIHDVNLDTWDGKTVAIGRDLMTNPLTNDEMQMLGLPGDLRTKKQIGQWFNDNPEKAQQLFEADMVKFEKLAATYPGYDEMNDVQKTAAVNLAYNMGNLESSGFVELPKALKAGDYDRAAKELLFNYDKDGNIEGVTKYVTDVKGTRAAATALMLKTGKVPSKEAVEALAQDLMNAQNERA